MIETTVHMACGCCFPVKEACENIFCPEHSDGLLYYVTPCTRCGRLLEVKHLKYVMLMCDECDREFQQAKVVYNGHNLPFVDPVLWHKATISYDVQVNLFLGYDEIQIDNPISNQFQKQTIKIRMIEKIKNLETLREARHA